MTYHHHFFEFNSDKIEKEFLDIFYKRGWGLQTKHSSYHDFTWPDIVLSEQQHKYCIKALLPEEIQESSKWDIPFPESSKPLKRDMIIDHLGLYSGGKVYLFINKIEAATQEFLADHPTVQTDFATVSFYLSHIVIIHELVHWLVDRINAPQQQKTNKIRYTTKEEIYFQEALAQYFPYLIFASSGSGISYSIFNWLLFRQPARYHQYKLLIQYSPEVILQAMEYCKQRDIQELTSFINTAKAISKKGQP